MNGRRGFVGGAHDALRFSVRIHLPAPGSVAGRRTAHHTAERAVDDLRFGRRHFRRHHFHSWQRTGAAGGHLLRGADPQYAFPGAAVHHLLRPAFHRRTGQCQHRRAGGHDGQPRGLLHRDRAGRHDGHPPLADRSGAGAGHDARAGDPACGAHTRAGKSLSGTGQPVHADDAGLQHRVDGHGQPARCRDLPQLRDLPGGDGALHPAGIAVPPGLLADRTGGLQTPSPSGRGALDAAALGAGLHRRRHRRLHRGPDAYLAPGPAAAALGGVYTDHPGHAGADHPVPVLLRTGDLRLQAPAHGGCHHRHDDLFQRLSGRDLARLHRGRAGAAVGSLDRPGHDALAAAALRDPAAGGAYFAAADRGLPGADRQEHLDRLHHRPGGTGPGRQAGQQCDLPALPGLPHRGRGNTMPIVEIDNITKRFGSNQVLNGISLSVERGQVVAIIGRSGSGKSTMLRCINGLETIDGGSITVAGHKLTNKHEHLIELRKDVGMVFQHYNLFPHLTVEENIMLSPRIVKKTATDTARETAIKVLKQVGLDHKRDAYPEQLSGGQQQRVAIARSLAMEPQVMLFDEVTSALDPELTAEVLKVMEELARGGMTMLLVTHEMEFARRVADLTVFMHQGKVWEARPSKEFFADPQTPEAKQFIGAGALK
ncbi:hypothetical protein Lal_00037155 [Lupinus albus]|nr:hypothetical protein Lal_00037155 [Lupinus albus]